MRETYVRPPLLGREPRSRWVTVWPLRVVALVLLALLAWGFVLLIKHILDPAAQAPGISLGRVAAVAPSAQGHR
jgi:hypothetical protein